MNSQTLSRTTRHSIVAALEAKRDNAPCERFMDAIGYCETPEMLVEQWRAAIAREHAMKIKEGVAR